MIVENVTDLIGGTPLLKISKSVHGLENIDVYAKLELLNPWGSVKDRTAWAMARPHLSGLSEKELIEVSSGNTAKALQMIALLHGSSLRTITGMIKVHETKDILRFMGVEIDELPSRSNCYDPTDPYDPISFLEREMAANPGKYIYTDQFSNDHNREVHYEETGKEIIDDLGVVDFFVGGLGTTGSSLGISERLKESNSSFASVGVVAEKGDFIPGIRSGDEMYEVGLYRSDAYEAVLPITSLEAIAGIQDLIQAGLLVGPSTGASFAGLKKHLGGIDATLTERKTAVFLACDRAEWYMSYIEARMPELFGHAKQSDWKESLQLRDEVELGVEDIENWIEEHKPLIIDLRRPVSYKAVRIEGSINVPFDDLDNALKVTNPYLVEQQILFVCPVGEKSKQVASYISTKGSKAKSLKGGMAAWQTEGLSLVRGVVQHV